MATIVLENLKNINKMEFVLPLPGVHILTGANGSGKTSLLTCLQRIIDPYAFQRDFKTSSNEQFDNFRNAKISYENEGNTVTYIYRNTRWAPNPKNGTSVLWTLGYTDAVFISSTGDRFYVQNAELTTKGIVAASNFIKESMNEIFDTSKYNDLRRKKLDGKGRGFGRWNYGYLILAGVVGGQNVYYTEKNFSLGEILILNALFEIENVMNDGLVLIDEIELALHPKVQVRFINFLDQIATQKNLTVILSTHSSSLIKTANNLIYLERNRNTGIVHVEYDCFPAVALQNMAISEEVQPDIVFFVEDNFARYILESMLHYYFQNLYNGRRPILKVLPVGGWTNTIQFTQNSAVYLIPANTRVYAILDHDVHPQIQALQAKANRTPSEQEQLNLYLNNHARINFLPITPEQGLVELVTNDPPAHFQPLQDHFVGVFDIGQIILDEANRGLVYGANPRKTAKTRLTYYIDRICAATNRDSNYVRIKLAEYYSMSYCPANHGILNGFFNPMFQ